MKFSVSLEVYQDLVEIPESDFVCGIFLYNSENQIEKSWEKYVEEARSWDDHSPDATARLAALESIKHPQLAATNFSKAESEILLKCLGKIEYLKPKAERLLPEPDYLSQIAEAEGQLDSFIRLDYITEKWNEAFFATFLDPSSPFTFCDESLDFKLVTLKSPHHVRAAINEILKRASAKSLLEADPTLIPVPYISNHQVFRAQFQLQPKEFSEVSVAGNSFIHPILSNIPVESINSDLHYTPPEIVVAPSPSAQVTIATRASATRSSAPQINKSRKTKAPCPECGKKDHKKVELCEFAKFVQEQKTLANDSPDKIVLNGKEFYSVLRTYWLEKKNNSRISLIFTKKILFLSFKTIVYLCLLFILSSSLLKRHFV